VEVIVIATGVNVKNHKLLIAKNSKFSAKAEIKCMKWLEVICNGGKKSLLCGSFLHHVTFGLQAPI